MGVSSLEGSIRKLKLFQLEPGMVVAKDIIVEERVLLTRGTVLKQEHIEKLMDLMHFDTVEMFTEKHNVINQLKYKNLSEVRIKQAKKIKDDMVEMNSKIRSALKDITLDKNIKTTSIQDICSSLMNEYKCEDADLIFKGLMEKSEEDEELYKHSVDVAIISSMIGKWMGMEKRELRELVNSALLHDIGKLLLDKNLIKKKDAITEAEQQILKLHSKLGYKAIVGKQGVSNNISNGVLMHHERNDGSGYPIGLKEENIHPYAKIIAIADVFDASTSNRECYKKKTVFEALEEIKKLSLKELDNKICNLFLSKFMSLYTSEYAMLSTGKVCQIIKFNEYEISRPLVMVENEFIDLSKNRDISIRELE